MKHCHELLGNIKSKEDFLKFMKMYMQSIKQDDVRDYLESLSSWINDMEGYYANTDQKIPQNINWDFIATVLYVGSIYE
ncbi:MAG: hypothetical protein IKK88_04095 [Oscillospiraceae bacterium]|nr:hypothetical protein [Oscillospiraceae bacterium]